MLRNHYIIVKFRYLFPAPQYANAIVRLYPMRLTCLLLLLFFTGRHTAQGQVRLLVYTGAGASHNIYKSNSKDDYLDYYAYRGENGFYVLPHAGVSVMVPIGKKLLFEGGINYTQKQFRGEENKIIEANTLTQLTVYNESKTRLHYLGLPFTLSYIFPVSAKSAFHLGAGINYGFLIKASGRTFSRQSTIGFPPDESEFENFVPSGLLQTSKTTPGTINIFDTGAKLQLSYVWHSKLILRLASEYSLYTVYLKADRNKPDLQLWYTGLSVGYIF